MRRRELLLSALGVFASRKFVSAERVAVQLQAGDYRHDISFQGDGRTGTITYWLGSLVPAFVGGAYYRTTVLERLRAAGVVEPNDPERNFFSTTARPDSFFKVITVRVNGISYRVKSESFRFRVNGRLPVGPEVSAGSHEIAADDVVGVELEPGGLAQVL